LKSALSRRARYPLPPLRFSVVSFQPGDVRVEIEGKPYRLRLTLGALAEISDRLFAPSPRALSGVLRALTSEQTRVLLSCLSCPPLEADGSAVTIADTELKQLLPDICRVFETAFLQE